MLWEEPHPDGRGYPVQQYRVSGKDYLWIKFLDGTQSGPDAFLTAKFGTDPDRPWKSTMIGLGCQVVILTARYNTDLFSGIPSGLYQPHPVPLYDIRKDPSAGGNGAHRWDNPATWEPTSNPATMIYNLARGVYYGSEWVYGGQNIAAFSLPAANWMAAANACDAAVTLDDGSKEPAFRAGYEVQCDQQPLDVISELLKGCNGRMAEVGGVFKMLISTPGGAIYSFSDDDIIVTEEQDFQPFPSLSDTYNAIEATYPEPGEKWATKDAPGRYNADLEVLDGDRRLPAQIQFPAVPFANQVQRVGLAMIQDYRRFRVHQISLPPDAYPLEPNDVVSWTSARNGYAEKKFLVVKVEPQVNFLTVVTLKEVDPADYDWHSGLQLPTAIGWIGSITPPSQPMTGWTVEPGTVKDAGGIARRPAIKISCASDMDDVERVWVQVRLKETGDVVFDSDSTRYELPFSWLISGQWTLPNTDYEARGRYIPKSNRATDWSAWLTVKTPNILISTVDILDDAITAAKIADAAVIASKIMDEAVTNLKLADAAVSTAKLQVAAVTAEVLADQAVIAAKIADGAINTAKFAAGLKPVEVVTSLPTTGNVEGRQAYLTTDGKLYRYHSGAWIATVDADDIDGTLGNAQIESLAASKITGQLTDAQIAAVAAAKVTGTLVSTQIADAAITNAKLAALAVDAAKLADGSVIAAKIADAAVTANKIASATIDATKFVSSIKTIEIVATLPSTGNVEGRTVYLTTDDKIYRYTGSAWISSVPSTDITGQLTDAQLAAISAAKLTGQITGTQITDGAISTPKLAAGAVTANEIAAGAIIAGKIAAGTVTATEIASGSVTTAKLAAGAVTANELAANSVVAGKLAAGAVTATQIAASAITADKLASNSVTTDALAVGSGNNLLQNVNFMSGLDCWLATTSGTIPGQTFAIRPATQTYAGPGQPTLMVFQNSAPTGSGYFTDVHWVNPAAPQFSVDLLKYGVPCVPGESFEATAYLSAHRCTASIRIEWRNAAGSAISSTVAASNVGIQGDSAAPDNWTRYRAVGVAPAGAVCAAILIRKTETDTGQTNSYMFVNKPMLCRIPAGATEVTPWSDGSVVLITNGGIVANAVTADKIAAGAITANAIAANSITATQLMLADFENMIQDGNFEQGQWATIWTIGGGTAPANFYLSTADSLTGKNSMVLDSITVGGPAVQKTFTSLAAIPVEAGTTLAWEIATRTSDGSSATGLYYRIFWYDKDLVALTTPAQTDALNNNPINSTWTVQSGRLSVPALAKYCRVRIYLNTGSTTRYLMIDRISLRKAEAANLIVDGSISAVAIAAGAITTAKLAAGAITASTIATDAVTTAAILAGSVTTAKIATGAITAGTIAAGAVTAGKLAANSVTAGNIAANAVVAGTIAAGAITATELAANSVTAQKLVIQDWENLFPDNQMQTTAAWPVLSSNTVINPATAQAFTSKGSIDYTYAGGSGYGNAAQGGFFPVVIGQQYFASMQAIRTSGTTMNIWLRVGWFDEAGTNLVATPYTTIFTGQTATAGVQSFSAAMTAPAGAVQARLYIYIQLSNTDGNISFGGASFLRQANANLIVDGAISAVKIAANAVTAGKIAANAVTAGTIAAGAVTATTIAAGTITGDKLAANTIGANQIAANAITAKSLVLTDFSNIADNGWQTGVIDGWVTQNLQNFYFDSNNVASSGYVLQSLGRDCGRSNPIAVSPGESYAFDVWVFNTDANTANVIAMTSTPSGVNNFAFIASTSTKNNWVRLQAKFTVPAGNVMLAMLLQVDRTAGTGSSCYWSKPIMRRAVSAELIVDGAITANAIAANAITAGMIQAGAISTDKLTVGGVTYNNIALGSVGRSFARAFSSGAIGAWTDITSWTVDNASPSAVMTNFSITLATNGGGSSSGNTGYVRLYNVTEGTIVWQYAVFASQGNQNQNSGNYLVQVEPQPASPRVSTYVIQATSISSCSGAVYQTWSYR
ncbi:phage tail protein [Rhizobium lusitanum]|uniref:phage tail protein n=1 Tax=Rhizobium lusitanum TaxID=293958 RepID=UPI0025744CFD|nr:phage tail protein [Rhizobium lusitanum]